MRFAQSQATSSKPADNAPFENRRYPLVLLLVKTYIAECRVFADGLASHFASADDLPSKPRYSAASAWTGAYFFYDSKDRFYDYRNCEVV